MDSSWRWVYGFLMKPGRTLDNEGWCTFSSDDFARAQKRRDLMEVCVLVGLPLFVMAAFFVGALLGVSIPSIVPDPGAASAGGSFLSR